MNISLLTESFCKKTVDALVHEIVTQPVNGVYPPPKRGVLGNIPNFIIVSSVS